MFKLLKRVLGYRPTTRTGMWKACDTYVGEYRDILEQIATQFFAEGGPELTLWYNMELRKAELTNNSGEVQATIRVMGGRWSGPISMSVSTNNLKLIELFRKQLASLNLYFSEFRA